MRLEDVYYTTEQLAGTPEPVGNPIPIDFYQGDDIIFEVCLNVSNKPVLVEDWAINAVVKKNKYAELQLWTAQLGNGIYKTEAPGVFKILVSSDATMLFVPGTYWITLSVTQLEGNDLKPLTFVIVNQPFSINQSAASTYPELQRDGTERTYPPWFDASHF